MCKPVIVASGLGGIIGPSIAVDATNVYFSSEPEGAFVGSYIYAVATAGGSYPPIAHDPYIIQGIAVRPGILVWASIDGASGLVSELLLGDGGAFDGGGPVQLVSEEWLQNVALDATNVYCTSTYGDVVDQTTLVPDGSVLTIAPNQSNPTGIAVDSKSVYWLAGGAIFSVPIGGPGDAGIGPALATDQANPVSIAADGKNIYWLNAGTSTSPQTPSTNGTVMQMPVNPVGAVLPPLASNQVQPIAMAVDSINVYWTTSDGNIMTVPIGGGTPTVLAQNQGGPTGLAVDSTSVYWISGSNVMKVAK
jgi:hypothetical protein